MILVSARVPEEIPWFKAWRRAAVAAMSAGGLNEHLPLSVVLLVFIRRSISTRSGLSPQNGSEMTVVA